MNNYYTWGEIQIEACKKMFLNNDAIKVTDLPSMKNDNKYKWYLNAMPQAANEAIYEIIKRGKKHTKRYEFAIVDDGTTNEPLKVDLKTVVPDFYRIAKLYYQKPSGYQELINNTDYQMLNNYEMVLNGNKYGNYLLEYQNYPIKITNETLDTEEIELEKETAALIPLYIASQLYKDDDIAIATTYRNEFEAAVENTFKIIDDLKFVSKTGWL